MKIRETYYFKLILGKSVKNGYIGVKRTHDNFSFPQICTRLLCADMIPTKAARDSPGLDDWKPSVCFTRKNTC